MKKGKKLLIIGVVILAVVSAILGWLLYSDSPFEAITVDEIEEIKVYAIPPEAEVVLSEAEVEKVVPLLQNLKVSKPGYKVFALSGQTITITIKITDGSIVEISNVGNVQIIIDGRNYRADYESAEAINNFANKVLETGF